jgi:hypothetical protein
LGYSLTVPYKGELKLRLGCRLTVINRGFRSKCRNVKKGRGMFKGVTDDVVTLLLNVSNLSMNMVSQDAGYEIIMMNSNPETVSTDYDTSDRLYFEPLTVEDVLNVIDKERPDGIIVQFGGQTPLNLALPIEQYLNEFKPMAASGEGLVRIWGPLPLQ